MLRCADVERHMNKVLAGLIADDDLSVGVLMEPPRLNRLVPSQPAYRLYVRSLKPLWLAEQIIAPEVVLEDGERVPVTRIGMVMVTWDSAALASGEATIDDQLLTIRADDLTADQAQRARWFVQRRVGGDPSGEAAERTRPMEDVAPEEASRIDTLHRLKP